MNKLSNIITTERKKELEGLFKNSFRDPKAPLIKSVKATERFWEILQDAVAELMKLDADPILLGTAPGLWDGITGMDWLGLRVGDWSAGQRRYDCLEGPHLDDKGQLILNFDPDLLEGLKLSFLAQNEPKNGYTEIQKEEILRNWSSENIWPKEICKSYAVLKTLEKQRWRDLSSATFGQTNTQWHMNQNLVLAIQNKTPWLVFDYQAYALWDKENPFKYYARCEGNAPLSTYDFGIVRYIHREDTLNAFECINLYRDIEKRPHIVFCVEDPYAFIDGKLVGEKAEIKTVVP